MSHANTDGIFFLTKESRRDDRARLRPHRQHLDRRPHDGAQAPRALRSVESVLEAASRIFAQDLEGTGVTVNVLLPGGAVDTIADVTGQRTAGKTFLAADVMDDPLLWLVSDMSNGHTGERFVGSLWNESLPLAERIVKARQSGVDAPAIM